MATVKNIKVQDLTLDLSNYRTVPQKNEKSAIEALIAINPNKFWGLMNSLLAEGYSPTENIIVLDDRGLCVKEGNRRVASLKLIHSLVKNIELPDDIQQLINNLPPKWLKTNERVPCAVYPVSQREFVQKLVSRTHAKNEPSGRDDWSSVAKARYGRNENGDSEPALDVLEKYLSVGKNKTPEQSERWAGDYPLTVLDEALKKIAPLVKMDTSIKVADTYPKKNKRTLDSIMFDIGIQQLGFKQLRAESPHWGEKYGLTPDIPEPEVEKDGEGEDNPSQKPKDTPAPRSKPKATPINDPNSVRKALRKFSVKGQGRDKIAAIVKELKSIRIENHPYAFCFLLRSVFELSAKAYCVDHRQDGGPKAHDNKGKEKNLVTLLRDITHHITNNKADKSKMKEIHGAMTELAKSDGILSVTSMNQLVHNPTFSISPSDVSLLFANLLPLLEEMNN